MQCSGWNRMLQAGKPQRASGAPRLQPLPHRAAARRPRGCPRSRAPRVRGRRERAAARRRAAGSPDCAPGRSAPGRRRTSRRAATRPAPARRRAPAAAGLARPTTTIASKVRPAKATARSRSAASTSIAPGARSPTIRCSAETSRLTAVTTQPRGTNRCACRPMPAATPSTRVPAGTRSAQAAMVRLGSRRSHVHDLHLGASSCLARGHGAAVGEHQQLTSSAGAHDRRLLHHMQHGEHRIVVGGLPPSEHGSTTATSVWYPPAESPRRYAKPVVKTNITRHA